MKRLLISAVLLVCLSPSGRSQTSWLRWPSGSAISVEYASANFATQTSFSQLSSWGALLSGRIRVSESAFVVAEIPYAQTTVGNSFFGGTQKETKGSIGNLLVGADFGNPGSGVLWEVRASLPTMPQEKTGAAFGIGVGDMTHLERHLTESVVLIVATNFHPVLESGLSFLLRLGPSLWIPTEGTGNESELLVDYGAGIGFETEVVRVGAGIGGRIITTEESLFMRDQAVHYIELGMNARIGMLRPASITELRSPTA